MSNAVTHGAQDRPVRVRASTAGGGLTLSVANEGEPIPPALLPELFKPFQRKDARPGQQGLGLGLYIAAQIAKAHGGSIEVNSTGDETRFVLEIPAMRGEESDVAA